MVGPIVNRDLRRWLPLVGVSMVIGVLWLLRIQQPLGDDQAMFATYARMMRDGAVLYQDVWDVKQPGIFYFYRLAGELFGFDEKGFRLLEVLVLMGGALAGYAYLHRRLTWPAVAAAFPLFAVAWFYVLASGHDLGQVEALVGPIILVYMLLTAPNQHEGTPVGHLILAGVAVGVLGWFKLILLPIPAAMAIVGSLFVKDDSSGSRWRASRRYLLFQLLGVLIPLLCLVAWFLANGSVDTLWYTYVTYPLASLERDRVELLKTLAFRGFAITAPLLALLSGTLFGEGRKKWRSPTTLMAVTWLLMSGLVVLPQTWWRYQASLAFFPAAWLATQGIDALRSQTWRFRIGAIAASVVLLLPAAVLLTAPLRVDLTHGFGHGTDREQYGIATLWEYRIAVEQLDAVDLEEHHTVMGDNVMVWLSGLNQGISLHGWIFANGSNLAWSRGVKEIETRRPDRVFLRSDTLTRAGGEEPDLMAVLDEAYEVTARVSTGVWYALKSSP